MKISLVAAISSNGVIGNGGKLPWHIPKDLNHFKSLTINKPMIMGRKTFQSIGKPLKGRTSIVITRNHNFELKGAVIVHTWPEALKSAKFSLAKASQNEVMIIGGAEIYNIALANADRLYLTEIHKSYEGDAMFPKFNRNKWKEIAREDFSSSNLHDPPFSFLTLERR